MGKLRVSEQLADTPSRHLCEGTRPQVGRGGASNTSFELRVSSYLPAGRQASVEVQDTWLLNRGSFYSLNVREYVLINEQDMIQ